MYLFGTNILFHHKFEVIMIEFNGISRVQYQINNETDIGNLEA